MIMEEEILNQVAALPERRNPFDEGIAKAVSSTRSNLGMNRDQQHRAINNALLALGNGLANEPVQRGFKNNLGVIGRAMNPALSAYNTSEDTAIAENERLANQILQHQRAEQALADSREEKAWHRKFQERALEEKKRYHNNSLWIKFAKVAQEKNEGFKDYEGKTYRTLDKADQSKAGTAKGIANETAIKNKDVNKSFEELEKIGKESWFHPLGAGSNIINPIKDTMGNVFGIEDFQKETALRNLFVAQLGQLRTTAERLNTGGGGITQGMYDRLSPYFADPKNDSLPTLKMKLDHLSKEIQNMQKAATIKHEQGIHFDVGDLETPNIESDFVLMLDPKTGKKDSIHKSWVQDAIDNDGLQVVNE
jgi:hypothetical protein